MFTDTHCHIYKEYYENIEEVIKNANENKVNRFINNGCDTLSNKEVIALAKEHKNIFTHSECAYYYQSCSIRIKYINHSYEYNKS